MSLKIETMQRREREREENKKLECSQHDHSVRTNIVILNRQRPLWEGD
jgi:hypothetical protein